MFPLTGLADLPSTENATSTSPRPVVAKKTDASQLVEAEVLVKSWKPK
jgi:hypothetical protein